MSDPDFDFEDQPGIPGPLPAGERVLWQGKPQWRELAIRAFHCRKVVVYFALVLIMVLASGWNEGATRMQLVDDALLTVFLGALALGILGTLAWLSARVTIYTLTNRRHPDPLRHRAADHHQPAVQARSPRPMCERIAMALATSPCR